MFRKLRPPPIRIRKLAFWLVGIYVGFLLIEWIWLVPSFVDRRVASHVTLGMSGADVAAAFGIGKPFDIPPAAHCSPANSKVVSRIALHTAGGVPLFPLPMILTSTTTFCFDADDRLVAFQTKRWVDGP